LFVGSKDVDVPASDARASLAKMRAMGGNATVIEMGPYTHSGVATRAVPQAQAWFKSLNK
jgi:hypothetical protein